MDGFSIPIAKTISRTLMGIVLAAVLVGCMSTGGSDFQRPDYNIDTLRHGDVTQEDIVRRFGEPYSRGTESSDGVEYGSLTYMFLNLGSRSQMGNRHPSRFAIFKFHQGKLVSYHFTSSFPDDHTDFDGAAYSKLKPGVDTSQSVISLLGPPSGYSVWPIASSRDGYIMSYMFIDSGNKDKHSRKTLSVGIDDRGKVDAVSAHLTKDGSTITYNSSPSASKEPTPDQVLSIGVVEFTNLSGVADHQWLSIAIPELAGTVLSRLQGVVLVERAELKRLLKERELELAGVLDEGAKSIAAPLLGAKYLVLGSYRATGKEIDVNARLIDTNTGNILRAESAQGDLSKLGDVIQSLVLRLSGAIGVQPTAAERAKIAADTERLAKTVKVLSLGEELYEAGRFEKARVLYKEALRANPDNQELLGRIRDIDITLDAVAIAVFSNDTGREQYDYLSRAIPEALSTSLVRKTGLAMTERLNLEKAIREMELGQTGIVDPATAATVGKISGATQMVIGSFQVTGKELSVFARIVGTESGRIAGSESATGSIDEVATVAGRLADKLIATFDSTHASREARKSITRVEQQMLKEDKSIALVLEESMVGFDTDSSVLKESSYSTLDLLAKTLLKFPKYRIVIIGHTDSEGPSDYNEELSSERAKTVLKYMNGQGVSTDRMTSIGYGENKPRDTNATAKGRSLNRRVEYMLIKQ